MTKLRRTLAWIGLGVVNGAAVGTILAVLFGWTTVGCNGDGAEAVNDALPFVLGAAGAPGPAAWLSDGKTIVAGLAGAYLAVEWAKRVLGVRVKTGDTFALPLALALAVGRWGCFFNGCCYGVETGLPWGVNFGDGVRRHPTQIYESLFHFGMALILIEIARRDVLRYQRLSRGRGRAARGSSASGGSGTWPSRYRVL